MKAHLVVEFISYVHAAVTLKLHPGIGQFEFPDLGLTNMYSVWLNFYTVSSNLLRSRAISKLSR